MAQTIPTWENEETCLLRIADARGGAPFSSKDTPTISHERATVSSKDLPKTRVHLNLITKGPLQAQITCQLLEKVFSRERSNTDRQRAYVCIFIYTKI